jgi:hypothetical protein
VFVGLIIAMGVFDLILMWATDSPPPQELRWVSGVVILLYVLAIWLYSALENSNQTRLDKLIRATKGGMIWPTSVKMHVIRAINDEASLALAAGEIGNRLFTAFSAMVVTLIYFAAMLGGLFVTLTELPLLAAHHLGVDVGAWLDLVDSASSWINTPVFRMYGFGGVLALAIGLFACACKSVYGRELLLAPNCEIKSDSAPEDLGSSLWVKILTGSPTFLRGLRHFIYNNVNCVPQ